MTTGLPHRVLLLASATLTIALVPGCPKPAPVPCHINASAVAPAATWSGDWKETLLDEPPNGWIGSFALAPDGGAAVYAHSLAGDFIPPSDGVSMTRVDLSERPDKRPSIIQLPGEALRNYASIQWQTPGIVWAHWSAFGTATPDGTVTVLEKIEKTGKDRPTFPLFASAGWLPGGDCAVAILEKEDGSREMRAWNARGASGVSHTAKVEPRETISGWGADGVLLIAPPPIVSSTSTAIGLSSARWLDPISGKSTPLAAPPATETYAWGSPGWLSVDRDGSVHAPTGEVLVKVFPRLTPQADPKFKQHHRWLRMFSSPSGKAFAVEEAVIAPRYEKRALHVFTRK